MTRRRRGTRRRGRGGSLGRPSRLTEVDVDRWWTVWISSDDSWLFEERRQRRRGRAGSAPRRPRRHRRASSRRDEGPRHSARELVDRGEEPRRREASRVSGPGRSPDGRRPAALFERRGYREVRRFYDMAIELTGRRRRPALPDGPRAGAVPRGGPHAPSTTRSTRRSRTTGSGTRCPFEEWWQRAAVAPRHSTRPSGSSFATATRSRRRSQRSGAERRRLRRRARRAPPLARPRPRQALLLHTFAEFRRAGLDRVTLGVDAENPTGATSSTSASA